MNLEIEIAGVLFTEMKDFIESSSDLDRKKFINSALTDFLFQNGCQVKHLRESYLKYLLNHSSEL